MTSASHNALQRNYSREMDYFDSVLFQLYWSTTVKSKNYKYAKFDKVIAKQ